MNYLPYNIKNEGVQVLYFYTQWMPFYTKTTALLKSNEEKYKWEHFAIDCDLFKDLCKKHRVNCVPVVIVTDNGVEVGRLTGVVLASALKAFYIKIFRSKNGK